jgi:ATP-dependent metalloprotease
MTTTLQAFLLCKPSLSPSSSSSSSKRFHLPRCSSNSSSLSFNPLSLSTFTSSTFHISRFCPRTLSVPCTLRPESADFDSERLDFSDTNSVSDSKDLNFKDFGGGSSSFNGNSTVSEFGNSKVDELGGGSSEIEVKSEFGEVGLGNGEVGSEGKSGKMEESDGKGENLSESDGKGGSLSEIKNRIPLMVFLMGIWVRVKKGFEKVLEWEWLSWWPFWRQEKRLERLIAEADANPKDVAKQSALLTELNKHRLGD